MGSLRSVSTPFKTVEYDVDPKNRRAVKRVNGNVVTRYVWQDQLRIIAELDSNNLVKSRFVYAEGVNSPEYMVKNGQKFMFVKDHRGSINLVVHSETGEIFQKIRYSDWGEVLEDTNPGFQPFGFAGGLYDPDTKLVRFGARDYDPEIGRWLSKDPIGFEGEDENLYGYSANDPINLIDSNGLFPAETMSMGDFGSGGGAPSVGAGAGGIVIVAAAVEVISNVISDVTNSPVENINAFSKGGKQNIRDSGLRDISDDEVSRRARDKSIPKQEREKYKTEEKARGARNKNKRGNKCP